MKDTAIRVARVKRGWSQLVLCHKTGLSYNTVAFAERGINITQKTADKLSQALSIRVEVTNPTKAKRNIADRARRAAKKVGTVPKRLGKSKKIKIDVDEPTVIGVPTEEDNGHTYSVENEPNTSPSEASGVGIADGECGETSAGVQSADVVSPV